MWTANKRLSFHSIDSILWDLFALCIQHHTAVLSRELGRDLHDNFRHSLQLYQVFVPVFGTIPRIFTSSFWRKHADDALAIFA